MSIDVMTAVWKESTATGRARLVLLAIADHQGEIGAWPSIDTLAIMVNSSARSVQRDIQELKESGELIVLHQQAPSNGQYKANLYWVNLPSVQDKISGVTELPSGVTDSVARGDKNDARGDTVGVLTVTKPLLKPLQEPARKATTIPNDFSITDEMREWAKQNHPAVDIDTATLDFKDYWETKAGDNKKTDWNRTWQRWIRTTRPNPSWKPTMAQEAISSEERARKRQREYEAHEAFIREREQAEQEASPIPVCEHGNTIINCLPCIRNLK